MLLHGGASCKLEAALLTVVSASTGGVLVLSGGAGAAQAYAPGPAVAGISPSGRAWVGVGVSVGVSVSVAVAGWCGWCVLVARSLVAGAWWPGPGGRSRGGRGLRGGEARRGGISEEA